MTVGKKYSFIFDVYYCGWNSIGTVATAAGRMDCVNQQSASCEKTLTQSAKSININLE